MEKRPLGNDAAFSMSYAPGCDSVNGNSNAMNTPANGDDEDVRKLNPNLVDPSGMSPHVGRHMTQHRQEKCDDICG
jgi:hypothetical protein